MLLVSNVIYKERIVTYIFHKIFPPRVNGVVVTFRPAVQGWYDHDSSGITGQRFTNFVKDFVGNSIVL
jgi:hypothetical protein